MAGEVPTGATNLELETRNGRDSWWRRFANSWNEVRSGMVCAVPVHEVRASADIFGAPVKWWLIMMTNVFISPLFTVDPHVLRQFQDILRVSDVSCCFVSSFGRKHDFATCVANHCLYPEYLVQLGPYETGVIQCQKLRRISNIKRDGLDGWDVYCAYGSVQKPWTLEELVSWSDRECLIDSSIIYLSIYLSFCLPVCLSTYLPIYQSTYLPIYQSSPI